MVCVLPEFVTGLSLRNFMRIENCGKYLTCDEASYNSCTWNVTEFRLLLCVFRNNWSRLSSVWWSIFSHHNFGWYGKLLVNGSHYRTNIFYRSFWLVCFLMSWPCNKVSCWNELLGFLAWSRTASMSIIFNAKFPLNCSSQRV